MWLLVLVWYESGLVMVAKLLPKAHEHDDIQKPWNGRELCHVHATLMVEHAACKD